MKVLFIAQSFDEGVPRNIRIREMFPFTGPMEIELLCFNGRHPRINMNTITIHRKDLTWFSSWFLHRDFSGKISANFIFRKFTGAVNRLYKMVNPLENWKWEQKQIVDFIHDGDFPIVVLMVAPFSNFMLADAIKNMGYCGKLVLDIGDPLYKNSAMPGAEDLIYQQIERKGLEASDALIVTNLATLDFYRNTFGYLNAIEVIPNGYKPFGNSGSDDIHFDFTAIKAIYAGAIYPKLRPVDPLLEAIQALQDQKVKLSLFSTGVKVPLCPSIFYSERVSSEELAISYDEANLLVYIDNNYGIQSSSKIYELLSLQKPILFLYTYESDNYRYCTQFPWVDFVRNEAGAIRSKLLSILGTKGNYSAANLDILAEYTWQNTARHYFDFLARL
ncbi:MAG: hypothetical protein IPN29_03945 [Saprospiraceae bacterium]|nr:hypothetical protein [Saprospiraceae bacterium]